jgi:hypothetical protein
MNGIKLRDPPGNIRTQNIINIDCTEKYSLSLDGNLKNVHIIITGKIETLKEILI